jgi:hypothetical protein
VEPACTAATTTEVMPSSVGAHVAFSAPDRATVDTIHAIARELEAEVLHEPREWPQFGLTGE